MKTNIYHTITFHRIKLKEGVKSDFDSKIVVDFEFDKISTMDEARKYGEYLRGDRPLWISVQRGKK